MQTDWSFYREQMIVGLKEASAVEFPLGVQQR